MFVVTQPVGFSDLKRLEKTRIGTVVACATANGKTQE